MDESEPTQYEVERQRLRDVARLILPLESKIRGFSKDHIEQLVVWLKNIHNPSDPEDRNVDVFVPFYNRVEELRNIPGQIDLQNQAGKAARSAIQAGMFIGGLLIVALWGVVSGWYVSLALLIAAPYLWRKALQFSLKSVMLSKEQEQKNVWRAIREAKNVPQLQAAGLYAYIDNNDFDKVTQHMRDAIYCNGEDGHRFAEHMKELKTGFD